MHNLVLELLLLCPLHLLLVPHPLKQVLLVVLPLPDLPLLQLSLLPELSIKDLSELLLLPLTEGNLLSLVLLVLLLLVLDDLYPLVLGEVTWKRLRLHCIHSLLP